MNETENSTQLLPSRSGAEPEKGKEVQSSHLPACPFCRQDDQLEIINWVNERADGSEYTGEAVRCNRCDAVTPLFTWLNLFTPNPLAGTQPENLTQD